MEAHARHLQPQKSVRSFGIELRGGFQVGERGLWLIEVEKRLGAMQMRDRDVFRVRIHGDRAFDTDCLVEISQRFFDAT